MKSKLSRRSFLTTTATATMVMASNVANAQTSAPKILRYTDHEPLGGMRTRFINDVFFPAIERESNGRLKIEAHWDGEVAIAYEALNSVGKTDNTDMATVVPEYTAEELPLHQIFKSFPKGPTGAKQLEFFRRVYEEVPELSEELARNDVVNIYFGTGYPVSFYSTKPIDTLDDIAGGKWRTASFWHEDHLRNAGATPVSMHWGPEIYDAMEAGEIDGLMVNIDSGYMLKIHEAAPNILASKELWLGHLYLLGMKKSTWEALADEDKAAIQRAAEYSYQTLGQVMDESFAAQVEELKKAGANIRVLDIDEATAWETVTKYQQVQNAWVETQQANGVENVRQVMDKITGVMQDMAG